MQITIDRAAFDRALGIENKSFWQSRQLNALRAALGQFWLDQGSPREAASRQTLVGAIYNWKHEKPTEFERYDRVSTGAVRKLAVQAGFDDYRPTPTASVLLSGNLRVDPQRRAEAQARTLTTDLVTLFVNYAQERRNPAVLVIDLYGDDFQAQGLNMRYDGTQATVKDQIQRLLAATRVDMGGGMFEHMPVFICAKEKHKGNELVGDFKNAITSFNRDFFHSTTNSVLHRTGLVEEMRRLGVTDVFVVGFDANMCVAATIFGAGGANNIAYIPGLLDYGINVLTSRFVLASGGQALRSNDGWPYMGPCNL